MNEGHTYRVDQPEIIPTAAAATYFPAKQERSVGFYHVDQRLRVRRVELEEAEEQPAQVRR